MQMPWKSKNESEPLQAAGAVLASYEKLDQTIAAEVANLQPLIGELQTAERELRDSEVAAVLGEQSSVTPAKARKRLDESRGAIEVAGRKLEGLRARLLIITAECPAMHTGLTEVLPAHIAKIADAFEPEWAEACARFGVALGRRQAIERLTGATMMLSDPSPAAAALEPELTRPFEAAAKLEAAIEHATKMHSATRSDTILDPHKVYQLCHDARGLPSGALVLSCTYPAGRLAHLLDVKWAMPARDRAADSAMFAIKQAKLQIEEAERKRLADIEEARGKEAAENSRAFQDKYYPVDSSEHDRGLHQGTDASKLKQNSKLKESPKYDVDGQLVTRPDPAGPPVGCVD